MLAILVGTGLLIAPWYPLLIGVAVFRIGTLVRISAADSNRISGTSFDNIVAL